MVLVNVYVPVLDQQFEFNLDEETRISNLLMEMGEMLKQIQMEEEIDQQDSLVLSDRIVISQINRIFRQCHFPDPCCIQYIASVTAFEMIRKLLF